MRYIESNIMIIEFNGLPGCGKTTIKTTLMNKINQKIKSIGVSDYSAENSGKLKRLFVKLGRILSIICPFNLNFSLKCLKLYFKSSSVTEFLSKSFYEDLIAVSYIVYLYREYKKNKNRVLVVDEGIIQVISSAITVKNVKEKYIDDIINDFLALKKRYMFINYDCDVNLSFERIKKRNRNSAAIDSLEGESLIGYLNKYKLNLNEIRQKVAKNPKYSLNLSAKLPLDQQIEIIFERKKKIQ